MVTESNTQINYRYPGIRPFDDNDIDRRLFFGRDTEKEALLHKILADNLVVLYARSGLGKTSLLNAGLSQTLRDRGFIPLMVRFNDSEFEAVRWIYAGIEEIAKQKSIEVEAGEKATLWQYFKTTYFWSNSNKMLTPVLLLDQFEEFFTLYSPSERKSFIRQLADVVNNKIPASLLESVEVEEPFPYNDNPPNVKIIISIREDYVGQLDEMSREIPDILHYRFRLLPLSREQARQAIIKPSQVQDDVIGAASFTFELEAVDMMLDFLCKRRERGIIKITDEVESFQLQLLCRHIEDIIRVRTKNEPGEIIVKMKELGGEAGMQQVLQRFYDDQVEHLGPEVERDKARKLCEEGLISITDRRLSLEEEEITRKFKVSKDLLHELVNRRLLRAEPRVGSVYYELSHDTLVNPIRESQKKRELQRKLELKWEQKLERQRERTRIRFGFFLISVLIILIGPYIYKNCLQNKENIALDHIGAGERHEEKKEFKEAIEEYKNAIKIAPTFAALCYEKIGDVQFRLKKYNDAINSYNQAIPTSTTAKVKCAAVYVISGLYFHSSLLANELSEEKDISTQLVLAMRFVMICAVVLQGKQSETVDQLKDFINYYKSIPGDYERGGWEYNTLKTFIAQYKKLPPAQKNLLLQLVALLESPKQEGDKKLKELEISMREFFK
jgi:tetratricopeptide (TPR) repeat protein